jgi:CelD/BcsL family acetyltransferase involved in cellulose biosynthesis
MALAGIRLFSPASRASSDTPTRALFVEGDPRLDPRLVADWQRLAGAMVEAPFTACDWIQTYIDAHAPDAERVTIVVQGLGGARALLPLVRERTLSFGVPVRLLRQPSHRRHPDRFDLLLADSSDGTSISTIWSTLRSRVRWDMLELAEVAGESAAAAMAKLAAGQGYPAVVQPARSMPYLPLDGAGGSLDAALTGTSAKFRANLRRRMRNLELRGPVRLTRTTDADPEWLANFFAMESAGWKGAGGSAIASNPRDVAHFRALATVAAATGTLSLYSLECDGVPVAMQFGLVAGGRYMVPKLAFDERFHEFAPGHLLVREVIRDCLARGLTEFDFLGDMAPWKREWTSQVRQSYRITIFNHTAAGRAAHMARFRAGPWVRDHWLEFRDRRSGQIAERGGAE